METVQEHSEILESLKEEMAFLQSTIDEEEQSEEAAEAVLERLEKVLSVMGKAFEYLEANPPTDGTKAGRGEEEAAAAQEGEGAETPAERPDDSDDVDGWVAFLSENPEDEEAFSHLERLEAKARLDDDWETVVSVLLGKVSVVEDTEERLEGLQNAKKIYEQEIGDLGKAFYIAQMAHALEPTEEDLTEELLRLAEATEQWADLVSHFNEVIPAVEDDEVAASLWLRAARIYSERLGRSDYATAALGKGLEVAPKNLELWDALASIYKKNEQWAELAQVLRKRVELIDDEEDKVFYLMELGELYETRLNDPVEARLFYEQVLDIQPENINALTALESIFRLLELWEPLVKVLRQNIELVEEPDQKRRLRRQVADILADKLESPKDAAKEFEELLEYEPDDEEVLRKLCDIYEELDQPKEYLRVAERLADVVDDPTEQIALYRRLVIEMEMDPETKERATEILENILTLDPGDDVVYRSLERRYIEEEAWEDLASIYKRHVENAASNAVKVEILKALASVQDEQLGEVDGAVETLEQAREIDGSEPEVLAALTGLYRRQKEWVKLVDLLSQRAELTEEDTERVELHRQIGEIAGTKLGDPEEAEKRLMKALELDPQNLGVVTALYQLYRNRGEWLRAAKMLDKAQELTVNPIQRAQTLYEIGLLYEEEIEDEKRAFEHWEKAIQVDPEHVEVADRLQAHYMENEEWDKAEPLLDMLVRKTADQGRPTQLKYHSRLGLLAREMKKVDKAIKHLEKARELDPGQLEVLEALADLKYTGEEWKAAANLYQAILVGHRQSLEGGQLVEIYHRLGTVKLNTGDKDKALNLFDKALEIDPEYEPSAQAVIHLRSEADEFEKVVATKQTLLKKTKDDEARHKLLLEIADLYMDKLQDPEAALDYFDEALEIDPADHVTLHKTMEIFTTMERWDKVAETVLRLADIDDKPAIQAKYHYTAGVIYRDELNDYDRALEEFENALDLNPVEDSPMTAIERILTDEMRWKELGRAYRRQFKRLPEDGREQEKVSLLQKMGDLYLDKLGETETAMAALEGAVSMDPSNAERNETLAKLYLKAGPDKLDKAIEQHQLLLQEAPYKVSVYKTLCDLYIRSQQKDKTWCLCSALNFLKQADEKQRIFFERYREQELQRARRKLNDDLWRNNLVHKSENTLLDTIMAGISIPAALMTAQPHRSYNLKRREKIVPEKDARVFPKTFVYAAGVLNVSLRPEIFFRPDQILPIQLANTRERNSLVPSWLVDPDKFQDKSDVEVAFEVARQLSFLRPERYLRRALPSRADLANALGAAVSIMVPGAPVDIKNPGIRKYAEHFKHLVAPMVFEQLTPVTKKLLASGPDAASIPKWLKATELTALQTGLLVCNDFAVVAKQVASESDGVTGIPAKERITQLLLFSVSERYFELRKHLGFAIG
jgi:tetratricopeptide (TPR) repeat protein